MFESKGGGGQIGLGGALSAWLFFACYGIIREVFHIDLHMLSDDTWKSITTHGSDLYNPLWALLLVYEFVLQFIMPVCLVGLVILYSIKSRLFPKLVVRFYLISFALVLIDVLGACYIHLSVKFSMIQIFYELAHSLIGICIWVPYFLKSERVKEIFIK
jgi:hypothetical protein